MSKAALDQQNYERWWHRFLKVAYVFAYLALALITWAIYSSGNQTYSSVDLQKSQIICADGHSYSFSGLGIIGLSYSQSSTSLYSSDETKAKNACNSALSNPNLNQFIQSARDNGYSDAEINEYIQSKSQPYRTQFVFQTLKNSANPTKDALIVAGIGIAAIEIVKAVLVYIVRGRRLNWL
ncbi:hypothetical protein HYW36_02705 [Candidatus Saccharibacteria bacterium]|nr:hypothetical protein [Candidatus Saccharibacteria bacterium]